MPKKPDTLLVRIHPLDPKRDYKTKTWIQGK